MKKESKTFDFTDQYGDFIMLGNGHIAAFLYCGTVPVVFDPGVSAFGPFYAQKIRTCAAQPESLIAALTHAHFDHCGAVPYLRRQFPGLKIAASRQAADILQRPNAVKLISRLNKKYEQEMTAELQNADVSFEALTVDYRLHEGEHLDMAAREYCLALATPGHTRDCLSYFFPEPGVLVAGEAVGVYEEGFIHSPFLTSFTDYINSIERLQALQLKVLCVAHNGILTGDDIKRFMAASRCAAIKYKDMVTTYLDEYDGDAEKVVQRITAEEYDAQPEHIQKRNPFILNLEAKVHAILRMSKDSKE